ncbi:MAG: hypothetical protein EB103_03355 [Actinobacteria bacterium]|nr:hypothetical protein [Actinomycetota bacterium]
MSKVNSAISAKDLAQSQEWEVIKSAALTLRGHQIHDGSIPEKSVHRICAIAVSGISGSLRELAKRIDHDSEYLLACADDFDRWSDQGFTVPDFYDSLAAFHPEKHRIDGLAHLVVFPMYTQNGSTDRFVEAVLFEVIWPEFLARLESADYTNPAFVPVRFVDFTPGYVTNSAVIFPESVAVTPRVPAGAPEGSKAELPPFSWGGIFADREAARYRRVVKAAAEITHLDLPAGAQELLVDQNLAEKTYVMWDLIHDRTHMRGDLPFDPFMIKQRMPFYLYGLEELRCDLTAFRESVKLFRAKDTDEETRKYAQLVQYAVLFDRIFRFPLSGNRKRNYDSVAGQLLFAYLHQQKVLHWTDTQLAIDWDELPDAVVSLSDKINELYWRSIDRPKVVHWLAAYDLVSEVLAPHPASKWAKREIPLNGTTGELTDQILDDEFPLSMFYEALVKKMSPVIQSTIGITGKD